MKKKAKDIWIGAQIIISEQEIVNNSLYKKQIEKRLLDAKNIIDLNGLMIMGINDPRNYEIVGKICENLDIESYLYYPLLADIPGFIPTQESIIVNYNGKHGFGDISQWKKWLDALLAKQADSEKFEFLCPNNKESVPQFFDLYKDRVDKCLFDGIFFDRLV